MEALLKALANQLDECPEVDGQRVVPVELARQISAELRKLDDYVMIPQIDLADAFKLLDKK